MFTGAGISAESGLTTFRGDGGLWEGHRVDDVATPEAWARNPALERLAVPGDAEPRVLISFVVPMAAWPDSGMGAPLNATTGAMR